MMRFVNMNWKNKFPRTQFQDPRTKLQIDVHSWFLEFGSWFFATISIYVQRWKRSTKKQTCSGPVREDFVACGRVLCRTRGYRPPNFPAKLLHFGILLT